MQTILTTEAAFNIWWVFTNGVLYYAEADFLLGFWKSCNRKFTSIYVIVNTFLTVAAIWTQLFFVFNLLHVGMLFIFSISAFKAPFKRVITPAIIIFTLATFNEGFVAILMRYLASTLRSEKLGMFFQFVLPAIVVGLFFFVLRIIAKKFPLMDQNFISTYLYILLLPSALIIAGIRISLGLDFETRQFSHGALITNTSALFIALWMVGALLVFFLMLAVFYKITMLSQQEKEYALLASALKEQHSYIDEARQRNEGYRSFQHDINNHLLVLSGLLHTQAYQQAESYLQKLNAAAGGLSEQIFTGNSVLDILLWEKVRYAGQCQITVTCDVQIPKESVIDDIDLCILFANGIDNAITACLNVDSAYRTIALTAKPKHSFLLVHMVNGIDGPKPIQYGTGLKNIELTAKKYAGTIHVEQTEHQFSLGILLCHKKSMVEDAISLTTKPLA